MTPAKDGADSAGYGVARAAGRSLAEFLPLSPAEESLLRACREGSEANVSNGQHMGESHEVNIRAGFLRFMLLGGDSDAPLHENGIVLLGAVVVEKLNLYACPVAPARFLDCLFSSEIHAVGAKFSDLSFINCSIVGLSAEGSSFSGSCIFAYGSVCRGTISLRSATIARDLTLDSARLYNRSKQTLSCDGANIRGNVNLNFAFKSLGRVGFVGASIGGSLSCADGRFVNRRGVCLAINGTTIGGLLSLSQGFMSVGEVQVIKTVVNGDVKLEKARLLNPDETALNTRSITVEGGLLWRSIDRIDGIVSFDAGFVRDLADDWPSWEMADHLILDGFRYDRISGDTSPTDATTRIKWLYHQKPEVFGAKFWPQPWEQLAKALRDLGHAEDAKQVAIEKQLALRKAGLIGQRDTTGVGSIRRLRNGFLNAVARILHRAYGGLAGFGYRPMKTVLWMIAAWLVGAAIYFAAQRAGYFGPTAPLYQTSPLFEACGAPGEGDRQPWTECAGLPAEHTKFNPLAYSLDVILPLVDLRQESDWGPIVPDGDDVRAWAGALVRIVMWVQILFGWIASLLLASALGRLVQKD